MKARTLGCPSTSAFQQIFSDIVNAQSEHQAMGVSSLGQPAVVCNVKGARAAVPLGVDLLFQASSALCGACASTQYQQKPDDHANFAQRPRVTSVARTAVNFQKPS